MGTRRAAWAVLLPLFSARLAAVPASVACTGQSESLDANQCLAWQAGFDALNGTGWNMCSEARTDPCGSCGGVTCLPKGSGPSKVIVRIILPRNNMRGTLPREWGALHDLTTLNLHNQDDIEPPSVDGSIPYDGSLRGSLPPEWHSMKKLTFLAIALNSIEGELPPSWGALSLNSVNLAYNRLSGRLPAAWANMSHALQNMQLAGNEFFGALPPLWGRLGGTLDHLNLFGQRGDGLVGPVPNDWLGSGGLSEKSRIWCSTKGDSLFWKASTSLREGLNTSTRLAAQDCYEWTQAFDAMGGRGWTHCADARQDPCACYAARVRVEGAVRDESDVFVQCINGHLSQIQLPGNNLDGTLPPGLGRLSHLSAIQLHNAACTSPCSASKGRLRGTLPPTWGHMKQLGTLWLGWQSLEGTLPRAWASMRAMRSLVLGFNTFSGTLPPEWAGMSNLRWFIAQHAGLEGTLPASYSSMTSLSIVRLQGNRFKGPLPRTWSSWQHVELLHLGDNGLNGTLPDSWSALTHMRTLYLQRNRLRGGLPASWASMKDMVRLQLQGNVDVQGPVPSSWLAGLSSKSQVWCDGTTATKGEISDTASFQLDAADCFAWVVGYDALGGSDWMHCSGARIDPCSCYESQSKPRIKCQGGRIAEVVLPSNKLSGPPPELWQSWTKITVLDLHGNALSGTVPAAWRQVALTLSAVRGTLRLDGNRLSGVLPSSAESWAPLNLLGTCSMGRNRFRCPLPPSLPVACGARCCNDGNYSRAGEETCDLVCPPLGAIASSAGGADCFVCPSSCMGEPCPVGTFGKANGSTYSCVKCPLHEYQDLPGMEQCKSCAKETINSVGLQLRPFTAERGSVSISACIADRVAVKSCPPGESAVHSNDTAVCRKCAAGQFKPALGRGACKQCPCGTFSFVGAADCNASCTAGTFGNESSSTCDTCPPLHFCLGNRARPFAEATRCSPGEYIRVPPSSTSDQVCSKCVAGRFSSTTNAQDCDRCPGGQYQPAVGATFCVSCEIGRFGDIRRGVSSATEQCQLCAAGRFSAVLGSVRCKECAAGQYQASVGSAGCLLCVPGWWSEASAVACMPCARGQFGQEHVLQSSVSHCGACPDGKYQEEVGKVFCETCHEGFYCLHSAREKRVLPQRCQAGMRCFSNGTEPCGRNQVSNEQTGQCNTCAAGHFAWRGRNECKDCPKSKAIACVAGIDPAVDSDWFCAACAIKPVWIGAPSLQLDLQPCRVKGVCNSSVEHNDTELVVVTRCTKGYTGALCGACAPGLAFSGGQCRECPESSTSVGVLTVGCIVFFGLFINCVRLAVRKAIDPDGRSKYVTMTSLKILIMFLYKSSLLSSYQLDWGASLRFIFGLSAAASSGDVASVAMIGCMGWTVHDKIRALFVAPIAVPLVMLVPFAIAALRGRAEMFGAPLRSVYTTSVLLAWWFLHPAILRECVMIFSTVKVGERDFLAVDLSEPASGAQYETTRTLAVIMLCTFLPMLPMYIFSSLFQHHTQLRSAKTLQSVDLNLRLHFFFFFGSFKPQWYFWELVNFTSKGALVLIAAQAATTPDPGVLVFTATWITLVAFILEIRCSPFRLEAENNLVKTTWCVLLALLLIAQGLVVGATNFGFTNAIRTLAACAIMVILLLFLFVFVHQAIAQIRDKCNTVSRRFTVARHWTQSKEDDFTTSDTSIEEHRNPMALSLRSRRERSDHARQLTDADEMNVVRFQEQKSSSAQLPTATTSDSDGGVAGNESKAVGRSHALRSPSWKFRIAQSKSSSAQLGTPAPSSSVSSNHTLTLSSMTQSTSSL